MVLDLLGKARRALSKPPRYVAERTLQEAVRLTDRWRAPARARSMTLERLLAVLEQTSLDGAWDALMTRPYPFLPEQIGVEGLDRVAPGESDRILAEAAQALAHRVDLLGSGPVELGPRIDWHTDYKTGRTWPPAYCHSIEYSNLDEPSDVKSPWELSRLQWLIPAGQAYILTGEERYAAGVREVLEQWIDANPYAWSVNWSCTMEVALRILTFSWFLRACGRSEAFADRAFRTKLMRSLVLHADFTDRYIERADVNGNHYTADAAGLVFAGLFLGDGAAARGWLSVGWRILEEEVQRQVFPDGVDFEASVPYHRLVAELFLLPAIYGRALGCEPSACWRERLGAMARFTAAYSRNDGSVPVWGDNDDARALPMAGKGLFDHRYLIAMTALGLDRPDLLDLFSGPTAEVAWLFGVEAAGLLPNQRNCERSSEAFPDGGFYVLAAGEDHVFVDCGPIGLAGRGGHGHNDLMSFEAVLLGQRLIVDPGCYVYTASPQERNAFRSTAYHNTPRVAGEEINRFIRPDYLWTLHNDAEPEVRLWGAEGDRSVLVMSHSGYERLSPPVRPVRRIELDHRSHSLTVDDSFEGAGYPIAIPMHLAEGVSVAFEDDGNMARLSTPSHDFCMIWQTVGLWEVTLESSRIASSYGSLVHSQRIVWRTSDSANSSLRVHLEVLNGRK